jgi:hypothetical protein
VATPRRRAAPQARLSGESPGAWSWLRRAAAGVGWVVTAGLCAAAVYGTLETGPSGSGAVADSQRLAGLEAESVWGRWLENAVAGPIYVIAGTLRSTESAGGPVGARLEVQLLDAGGAALEAPVAAIGPALAAEELREQDPRGLEARQAQAAPQLARIWLAPGQRQPFHAVFAELPPAATGFRLRAHPLSEPLADASPPATDVADPQAGPSSADEG